MNELNLKHNINVDISMYNANGHFTISAYQRMIMGMIEEHLDELKLGEKFLMENHGISWVLLSTSIELRRNIKPTEKLIGTTWHAGGRVPSFRRDFNFNILLVVVFNNGTNQIRFPIVFRSIREFHFCPRMEFF